MLKLNKLGTLLIISCGGLAQEGQHDNCYSLEGDFDIICQNALDQGLFSSAVCYTEEELEQVLTNRAKALELGSCEPKQYVIFPEPREQEVTGEAF